MICAHHLMFENRSRAPMLLRHPKPSIAHLPPESLSSFKSVENYGNLPQTANVSTKRLYIPFFQHSSENGKRLAQITRSQSS